MSTSYLNLELSNIRSRTRKFMAASVVLHAVLFICLYLTRSVSPEAEGLVEVTWLTPVERVSPAAKSVVPPVRQTIVQKSSVHKTEEHFVRPTHEADIVPQPQISKVAEDKLKKQLVSLQRDAVQKNTQIAMVTVPSSLTSPTLAGVAPDEKEPGAPGDLARATAGSNQPVELQREPVRTSTPALAGVEAPEVQTRPQPAKPTDTAVSRTVAGASLSGPVADRPLISYSTPAYPEWAKRECVEGSPTIYFVVLPDGRVKESVVVQKTSGFDDFDRNAIEALLTWRFEPLRGDQSGEQWGTITFHFRLNNARSN
jgi:protein TonB